MDFTLETYEWDNTWIEKTCETYAKRVLYIGDSISCGTRVQANKLAEGKILFDGFGTSKSLDNPYYFQSVSLFAEQAPINDIVIFNNGLHGWHLSENEYAASYNEFLDKLVNRFSNSLIFNVLTTYVTNVSYHNVRVIERNRIVKEISSAKSLPVIDLYTVSKQNSNLLCGDGVHFTEDGYKELAKEILKLLFEKNC